MGKENSAQEGVTIGVEIGHNRQKIQRSTVSSAQRRNLRLLGWAGTEHKEAKFPSYYNCQTRLESFSSWLTAACVLDHPLGHYLLWGVGGDVG